MNTKQNLVKVISEIMTNNWITTGHKKIEQYNETFKMLYKNYFSLSIIQLKNMIENTTVQKI